MRLRPAARSRAGARGRAFGWPVAALGAVFLLGACAETELAVHAMKKAQRLESAEAEGEPVPSGYKLGKPYQVNGVWYYPSFDRVYEETGLASWYGPKFNGRPTASGERFDMNDLTAAHQTLPLPSSVRVTNLENGRSVVLRVNDRGPFVNGRIIDVSRRGAQLLGFQRQGTAKVRVEFLGLDNLVPRKPAPTLIATAAPEPVPEPAPLKAVAAPSVSSEPLANPQEKLGGGGGILAAHAATPPEEPLVTPRGASAMFIQVGAFQNRDLALRLGGRIGKMSRVVIQPARLGDRTLYRVRLGPVAQVGEADILLARLIRAGFTESRIVIERSR